MERSLYDRPIFRAMNNPSEKNLSNKLEGLDPFVNSIEFAEEYMGLEYGAFAEKYYAYDMNKDEPAEGFTAEERELFAGAILDLSNRLREKATELLREDV